MDKLFVKSTEIDRLEEEIERRRNEALVVVPGDEWAESATFEFKFADGGRIYKNHESGHSSREYYLAEDGKLSTICQDAGIEYSEIE